MPAGSELGGGLGALGAQIAPEGIAALLLKQPPGPVGRLISAGAVSPDTARRAATVDIPRVYVLEPAIRRRIVHRTADGRYWVDVDRNRRFRRRVAATAGGVVLLLLLVVWEIWARLSLEGAAA
ncbi:MAG: hypothetical protein VX672_00650 [Planctomycetota bacterium]|nr:hypothetical protein [Planctomycetota bacterium]